MSRTTNETKIALLLAKAEDPAATPAEAELATAQAEKLMLRHGIERAMLADAGTMADEPIELRHVEIRGVYRMKMFDLLNAVSQGLGTVAVTRYPVRDGVVRAHLVGRTSDVDTVETLFRSLERQALSAVRVFWSTHPYNTPFYRELGPVERREFVGAFARGVRDRLDSARTEATDEAGPSAALVLVSRMDAAIAQQRELLGHARSARSSKAQRGSATAHQQGHAAGRTADVGERRIAGRFALTSA